MPWNKKTLLSFLIFGGMGLVLFLISLKVGVKDLSWADVLKFIFSNAKDEDTQVILRWLRWPRTCSAYGVGFLLAISGCVLQGVLKNPLADAYTLGISGGGALGAVLILALNVAEPSLWVPVGSSLGALSAISLVLTLAGRQLKSGSKSLILVGVMIALFFGALSVFAISLLPPIKSAAAMSWLIGEFGSPRDEWILPLMLLCIPLLLLLQWRASNLDALSLGDYKMISLGLRPRREKIFFIVSASLLTSLAISIAGLIGFIGLVSAHIARRCVATSANKVLLPLSGIIGGALLLASDVLGRSLGAQSEIPAGSLSAIIGAPLLIAILLRGSHVRSE